MTNTNAIAFYTRVSKKQQDTPKISFQKDHIPNLFPLLFPPNDTSLDEKPIETPALQAGGHRFESCSAHTPFPVDNTLKLTLV